LILRMSFFLALTISAAICANYAIAQGRACIDNLGSEDCADCLARFPEPSITSLMCYGGQAVPESQPLEPRGLSCDFSTCPTDIETYRQCIALGRQLASIDDIKVLEDRASDLIEGELDALCEPDSLGPLVRDVDAIMEKFQDFNLDSRRDFSKCIATQIEEQNSIIVDQRAQSTDTDVAQRLQDVRIRKAGQYIEDLYELRGRATVIGFFERGEDLRRLGALVAELQNECP
jgi:hypothetical protein